MNIKTKYKGFTLIEMIIAISGFLILMTVVLTAYIRILKIKDTVEARQSLIVDSYFTMEKINILLKDFTIDYEEYFNRSTVGCDSPALGNFQWDVGINGYCDMFTKYGNGNSALSSNSGSHYLYYCSSTNSEDIGGTGSFIVFTGNSNTLLRNGCYASGYQSFGQYARQFRDMRGNVDTIDTIVNDEDDEDLGVGPPAILNSTGIKELYLISQDGTQRLFFRRVLISSGDRNSNGTITGDTEHWYNIQVLRLKGLDAGSNHDFNTTTSSGVFDGIIDTRACDFDFGFKCNGSSVGGAYVDYNLPSDVNDGWVNLFSKNITVSDRNIFISPTKNPKYSRKESKQINPYFTISFNNKLYGEIWQGRFGFNFNLESFDILLQTSFNTKNFYGK